MLVVGAGNSGCDLAVDAAMAGRETTVSVRSGLMFQPKTLYGRPRSELPLLGRLPVRLQERVTRALIDVAIGRPERYGLPAPATRNLHRNKPVVNGQLLHFIHHGRVRVAPAITRFDGHDVHFADGSVRAFDTIVYATGFKASLPFLEPGLLPSAGGVPLRVAGMTLPVVARAAVLRRPRRPARPAAPRLLRPGAARREVPDSPGARPRAARGRVRARVAAGVPDRHPAPRVDARHGPRAQAHRPRPAADRGGSAPATSRPPRGWRSRDDGSTGGRRSSPAAPAGRAPPTAGGSPRRAPR